MLVTQAAYSRHRKVTEARVSQWVRDKRLVTRLGKIDLERSDRKLDATLDVSKAIAKPAVKTPKAKPIADPLEDLLALPDGVPLTSDKEDDAIPVDGDLNASSSYAAAKIRRERFAAKMAEAQYRKMVMELVELSAVTKAIADNLGPAVRGLSGLGARIASRVAAEYGGDARRCQTIIDNEIETFKEELAEVCRALPDRLTETQQ